MPRTGMPGRMSVPGRTAGWMVLGAVLVAALFFMPPLPAATPAPSTARASTPPAELGVPRAGPRAMVSTGTDGWYQYPTPSGFEGLFYPSLASDPVDNYTVLFGGCTGVECPSGDTNATWVFQDSAWTRLNLTAAPPPRGEAQMAWDPSAGAIILFGGTGCTNPPTCSVSGPLNDTWAFSGGRWSEVPTTGPVPKTLEGSMAYDPSSGDMVLYGGFSCISLNCGTWVYRAGTWTELNLTTLPPFRYGGGFVEDDADHGALLFGGIGTASGAYLGDTWLFSGGAWNLISPGTAPSVRVDPQMAWDSDLDEVILFGGSYVTLSNFPGDTYGDTWAYRGGTWTDLNPVSPVPGVRSEGAVAVDPSSGELILVGGCGPSGCPYADTWGYGPEYSVTVTTPQPPCAVFTFEGNSHSVSNASVTVAQGTYALVAKACAGSKVVGVNGTGGVSMIPITFNSSGWFGWMEATGPGTVQVAVENVSSGTTGPGGGGGGGTSSTSSSGLDLTELLVLIVVAVVVVAAIVVVVATRSRRRPPPRPPGAPVDPSETAPQGAPGPIGADPGEPGGPA